MLVPVRSEFVFEVWEDVKPILQKAINKSQHDYTAEDILNLLHTRDMQLWVWIENNEIVACLITMIVCFPNKKICQLPYIAGKSMRNWLTTEQTIIEWARANGCSQLEGFCRDGWLKVLAPQNWIKVWTTMRKDI